MPTYEWKPEYSVNIKRIDEDHKKLVTLLDNLFEALSQGKGAEIQKEILGQLINYSFEHFAFEEVLMGKYNYPDIEAHKKLHDFYITSINEMTCKLIGQKKDVAIETAEFLKDWLIKHIMVVDKKCAAYFKSLGVE